MNDLIGRRLGPYEIVQPLGQGGMATVYKAYQASLQRHVAVKILPSHLAQDPQFSERFTREARAIARLEHPNILSVYDFGQTEGITYIVMKYVEGGTLKDLLERGKLDLDQAALILGQVASALDYAHGQGIVHRDIKPANVLLARPDWALLSDFGLAKVAEATVKLTGTGVGMGTPEYMAPEQAHGYEVDARADIYALGVTLYAMVTGQPPYSGATPIEVILKHVNDPLPSPRSLNPALPPAAEAVIQHAMAKRPAERPATAGELSRAFSRALSGAPGATATQIMESAPQAVAAAPRREATILESGDFPLPQPHSARPQPQQTAAAPPMPPPAAEAKRGGLPWLWIGAVLAAVLVCGALLTGGAVWGGLAMFAGPTATATAPPPSPTLAATATPPATATASAPTPTEAPPTPAAAVLFEDDFSDKSAGWDEYSGDNAAVAYADGEYRMQLFQTSWFAWANPEGARLSLSNVHIAVTARNTGAATEPGFGILCSYKDGDNYYSMGISVDGYYIILRTLSGQDTVLSDASSWIPSDVIPINAPSYRLEGACGNGTLTLGVNGQTIATVNDSSLTSGTIGLFVRSFDQANVEIRFDDLVVTALD